MKSLTFGLLWMIPGTMLIADPGLFQLEEGLSVAKVRFHLFDNKIVVPIKLNNKVTLNFILDSGVSQPILLDRNWGKVLGLEYVRSLKFGGVGNQVSVRGKISEPGIAMKMGQVFGNDMTMVVLDYDILKLHRFDIHGILGTQLFLRFVIRIDYENRELLVIRPDEYNPPEDFEELDMELVNLKPHLNVSIPGYEEGPVKLLVDTGASYSVLLYHPKASRKGRKSTSWYGLSGEIKGHTYKLPALNLGALKLECVPSILVNPSSYSKSKSPPPRVGSVGGAFLKHYQVIFDYGRERFYLKPNKVNTHNATI